MSFLPEIELVDEEKTRKGLIATSLAMILVSHSVADEVAIRGFVDGIKFSRDGILTALSFLLFLFLIRIAVFNWMEVYKGIIKNKYKIRYENLSFEYGFQTEEDLSDITPDREYRIYSSELTKERDVKIFKLGFWTNAIFKDYIPMLLALYCSFKYNSFDRVYGALYDALGIAALLEIAQQLFMSP